MTTARRISIFAALVLVQAFAISAILDRFSALLGFLVLALAAVILLAVPAALRQVKASVGALGRQLRWWHWLWLFLFLSDLTFRIRDANEIQDSPVDFWAGYRMGLVGACGLVLAARFAMGHAEWVRSLFQGLARVLAIYCAVCVVSTAWSVYPQWTLYKAVEYLIDASVLAAILAAAGSVAAFKSLFDWTWALTGLLMGTVWAGALAWPGDAFARGVGTLGWQLVGVAPNVSANSVGEISALLAVVALARLLTRNGAHARRAFYGLVFAASLITLILSQTRSALTAFVFGVAALLFFSRRVGIAAFSVLGVLLAVFQSTLGETAMQYFLRGQDRQLFGSLSGRTEWWAYAWAKFLERPLTGYGAYAGGRFVAMADLGDSATSSIHSTYIEVLLGTSIWGLLPVIALLAGAWWLLARGLNRSAAGAERELALEALAVLGVITVRSVFTTHLIWHASALPFLLVLGYAEFLRRKRQWRCRPGGWWWRHKERRSCAETSIALRAFADGGAGADRVAQRAGFRRRSERRQGRYGGVSSGLRFAGHA